MNTERPEIPELPRGESFDTDDVDPGIRVASPCVGVCVINDDTGRCAGCHRTLDEVAAWSSYSEAQRRQVIDDLQRRRREGSRKDDPEPENLPTRYPSFSASRLSVSAVSPPSPTLRSSLFAGVEQRA
jgi:hypothetical protein